MFISPCVYVGERRQRGEGERERERERKRVRVRVRERFCGDTVAATPGLFWSSGFPLNHCVNHTK